MTAFLDLIFPKVCYSCHQNGNYFCPKCIEKMDVNQIHVRHCHPFNGSLNLFPYNSAIKDIITDLKYNFVTDVVEEIAALMFSNLKSNFPNLLHYWQTQKFVLIPVSLSHFRNNWRGFNQSILICSAFSEISGLKCDPYLLIRNRHNPPQVSLAKKADRVANSHDLFKVSPQHQIPQNVIIFDDVCTTMSTLKSAAKPLVDSGQILEIWGLSLAGYF